jgi:hypothetical protein
MFLEGSNKVLGIAFINNIFALLVMDKSNIVVGGKNYRLYIGDDDFDTFRHIMSRDHYPMLAPSGVVKMLDEADKSSSATDLARIHDSFSSNRVLTNTGLLWDHSRVYLVDEPLANQGRLSIDKETLEAFLNGCPADADGVVWHDSKIRYVGHDFPRGMHEPAQVFQNSFLVASFTRHCLPVLATVYGEKPIEVSRGFNSKELASPKVSILSIKDSSANYGLVITADSDPYTRVSSVAVGCYKTPPSPIRRRNPGIELKIPQLCA